MPQIWLIILTVMEGISHAPRGKEICCNSYAWGILTYRFSCLTPTHPKNRNRIPVFFHLLGGVVLFLLWQASLFPTCMVIVCRPQRLIAQCPATRDLAQEADQSNVCQHVLCKGDRASP
eukprot:3886949-Amphidinium_carterae.1